jgi:hypothetical protein
VLNSVKPNVFWLEAACHNILVAVNNCAVFIMLRDKIKALRIFSGLFSITSLMPNA